MGRTPARVAIAASVGAAGLGLWLLLSNADAADSVLFTTPVLGGGVLAALVFVVGLPAGRPARLAAATGIAATLAAAAVAVAGVWNLADGYDTTMGMARALLIAVVALQVVIVERVIHVRPVGASHVWAAHLAAVTLGAAAFATTFSIPDDDQAARMLVGSLTIVDLLLVTTILLVGAARSEALQRRS